MSAQPAPEWRVVIYARLSSNRKRRCPECQGTGLADGRECAACKGTGKTSGLSANTTIQVAECQKAAEREARLRLMRLYPPSERPADPGQFLANCPLALPRHNSTPRFSALLPDEG